MWDYGWGMIEGIEEQAAEAVDKRIEDYRMADPRMKEIVALRGIAVMGLVEYPRDVQIAGCAAHILRETLPDEQWRDYDPENVRERW